MNIYIWLGLNVYVNLIFQKDTNCESILVHVPLTNELKFFKNSYYLYSLYLPLLGWCQLFWTGFNFFFLIGFLYLSAWISIFCIVCRVREPVGLVAMVLATLEDPPPHQEVSGRHGWDERPPSPRGPRLPPDMVDV